MHATALSPVVDLSEPVRFLLAQKGNTVWSVSPDATVYEAIESMSAKRVGSLVVVDGGCLTGIVTERDYARKVILKGRQSRETRVHEIMSAPVLVVTPKDRLALCMQLMTSGRIRYLPVVEGERVVGMVSIGDLVNRIISAQEQTIRHLHSYIAGAYPG